jgi:hypothetical protein
VDLGSVMVAAVALVISILSFYFSIKSWRESNRPIVTARVTAFDGGELGTALNILVENTGNRPAKDVRLTVNPKDLDAALVNNPEDRLRKGVEKCFSERGVIPILGNGKSVSNDFGWLSGDSKSTWNGDCRFSIEILYEDLDGRKYSHTNPLLIADDKGFAGGFWSDPEKGK